MQLVLLLVMLFTSKSFSKEIKKENHLLASYLSDAKVSQSTADLYRAYKIYSYLYENNKDLFYQKAIIPYISTVRELGSVVRLQQVCDILTTNKGYTDIVNYSCGHELFYIHKNKEAEKYLSKISIKSSQYLPAQILLASIQLANEDHVSCLKIVNEGASKRFEKENLSDIYYMTRARCLAKSKRFDAAITSYQSVPAKSKYYFDALTELSWVFFKNRDVELVRNSTKVIQASFKKNLIEVNPNHATINQYFLSKYLLAYLDLVVYGLPDKEKFTELSKEVDSYLQSDFLTKENIKKSLISIQSASSYSELMNRSIDYKKTMYHFAQWLPSESIRQLTDNVRFLIAINKEYQRFNDKVYGSEEITNKAIKVLRTKIEQEIKVNIASMYDESLRTINGFKLKIKIGEIDLKNLSKTEGLKNLDEATTIYKEKENSLAQKMGLDI